ncbi:hypothetical protein [Chondromyces crocatus]|uniref:Uncharacterized protein n=1 Tax=Chondromyces crocatus TaxID=52 RepID=A0A0K1EC42_CHOCO|nr:hypothetical protein [Chondromyces crocatus]AKT38128.1 uncharacterized protein CMC5_022700 [Chondromyces crocatus]
MPKKQKSAADRVVALAGNAPRRRANVRELARYAATSNCNMAVTGFAARVDFDQLLQGTAFAAPFGQSPFAFRRGNRFEELLRRDEHAPILALLKENLSYDTTNAKVANLREGQIRGKGGLAQRAAATGELVKQILAGSRTAPNLIDGAVFEREVGGVLAHFEADAVAARFAQPIHVGEIKSFPTIDGQADPDKLGAAVAQVSVYIVLLRALVERVGGNPEIVSAEALLITAKNTGLQPTLCVKPVGREVDRAARILDQAPTVDEVAASIPESAPSFSSVAAGEEAARLDALAKIADVVGTDYRPGCLASCGLSRFCRERAHHDGNPNRLGGQLVRLLPGIASLDRAGELSRGAPPSSDETAVAEQLVRAARLRDHLGLTRPLPVTTRGVGR